MDILTKADLEQLMRKKSSNGVFQSICQPTELGWRPSRIRFG